MLRCWLYSKKEKEKQKKQETLVNELLKEVKL